MNTRCPNCQSLQPEFHADPTCFNCGGALPSRCCCAKPTTINGKLFTPGPHADCPLHGGRPAPSEPAEPFTPATPAELQTQHKEKIENAGLLFPESTDAGRRPR